MTAGWDRFSQENRYLLDAVSFAVTQCGYDEAIGVHAAVPELYEDLCDRIGARIRLELEEFSTSRHSGTIHLLTWEQGLSEVHTEAADFVVIAFRNRLSVKSLKYGVSDSLPFSHVTRHLMKSGMIVRSWGIYGPTQLGWYQLAHWADRLRRYDWGFYLRDHGALSPIVDTVSKRWANFGLVMGVRQ